MPGIINATLRGLALLWTLLITALIGNVIASNISGSGSAARALNYTMFVAAWSWVASLYGIVTTFISALGVPMLLLFLDGFAVLFTFVDAILLAAKLHAVDCGNIPFEGRGWIGFGSHNTHKRCREIQASTAFMWFLWAVFCGCLFFSIREWRGGFGGFRRSTKPSMTQVGV